MSSKDFLVFTLQVSEKYSGRDFRVEFENGQTALAYLCGKMIRNSIRVVAGDKVRVEFSPIDLSRGRIVRRVV